MGANSAVRIGCTPLIYLVPPAVALEALLLFGETLTLLQVAGMAVTAIGVALVVKTA